MGLQQQHLDFAMYLGGFEYEDRRENAKNNPKGKKHHQKKLDKLRKQIDSVVVHAMGFRRSSRNYDDVKAHFAVDREGRVIYLHDCSEYLYAAHDFNQTSVSIEFACNPPDASGKPHSGTMSIPTVKQIEAGRKLIRLLRDMGIKNCFGHRQSCRKICPGPHLWFNLVKWASDSLGMYNGEHTFSTQNDYCSGTAIPTKWNSSEFEIVA